MEEKINLTTAYEWLRDELDISKVEAAQYSPLPLAYMGDAVYELIIRTKVVSAANMQVGKLNKQGNNLAMATTQAQMVTLLSETHFLTEEEERFVKRGKNAKVVNIPKSATATQYHLATGFECLLGYLYLSEQFERAVDIIVRGWELLDERE
ncbi:MAG: ribonuclease III [Lachnospiraceae bacterium]|nr:ribonuclease III [Lachnospiraceae bacterium]